MNDMSARYGASGLGNRGLTQPRRTAEQVEHRYELMQQYRREIDAHKLGIRTYQTLIKSLEDEILKKQEILDNMSRGENIPGETY